jgi:hypothetical protein
LGISKSIDADEQLRKDIESRREEIRKEFELDLARNVSSFWQEREKNVEDKIVEIEDDEKGQDEAVTETTKKVGKYFDHFCTNVVKDKKVKNTKKRFFMAERN